jgi:hypothetical protein
MVFFATQELLARPVDHSFVEQVGKYQQFHVASHVKIVSVQNVQLERSAMDTLRVKAPKIHFSADRLSKMRQKLATNPVPRDWTRNV